MPLTCAVAVLLLPNSTLLCMYSTQLVNQFPFEACLIRKDLLPQTLRRFHAAAMDADAQAAPCGDLSADFVPSWFPTTYDLATEVHFFLQDYKKVCKDLYCSNMLKKNCHQGTWVIWINIGHCGQTGYDTGSYLKHCLNHGIKLNHV